MIVDRRRVHNHIGTARDALQRSGGGNGALAEVTIPADKLDPQGDGVAYTARPTDITCIAETDPFSGRPTT